jgi:hypothetical protein
MSFALSEVVPAEANALLKRSAGSIGEMFRAQTGDQAAARQTCGSG